MVGDRNAGEASRNIRTQLPDASGDGRVGDPCLWRRSGCGVGHCLRGARVHGTLRDDFARRQALNARDDTLRRQISLTLRPGRRVDDSLRVDSSLRSAMRFVGLDRPICRTHLWCGRGI